MGLFKFALPTFAKEEVFWEEEEENRKRWKTVPIPPNKRREELVRRQKRMGGKKVGGGMRLGGGTVAYVVDISLLGDDEESMSSLRERAAVLAASIKAAHENSLYKYQLYAIHHGKSSSLSNEKVSTIFSQLGYQMGIDVEIEHQNQKQHVSEKKYNISGILANNIVVHLNLESLLLKSLDSVIDSLFKEGQSDGVSYSDGPNTVLRKRTNHDKVFTLKSTSNDDTHPMYIFQPKSDGASMSYLELLKCLSSSNDLNTSTKVLPSVSSMQRRDSWQPTLYPKIRSLLASDVQTTNAKDGTLKYHGKQCRVANSIDVLDKCIFAAGSQKCSHLDVHKSALIASFNGDECLKPWECERNASGDGCVNNLSDESANAECEWLQSKWFKIADSLQ